MEVIFQEDPNHQENKKHNNPRSMALSAPETIALSFTAVMTWVPCVGFPHWWSLSGDGSYTGEVVLCLEFVEQARHEHMPDEKKNSISLIYLGPHHGY